MKNTKLRNNEYYSFQEIQDKLYKQSREGLIFNNLIALITKRENILLAYRSIKNNKGSQTKGTNNTTIADIKAMGEEKLVKYIQDRIKNFNPHSVRRKEIRKDNGKIRPLGIPTMEDRILQQCIKQILEPILEAKFYKHSYGFRHNRSTEHAIARAFNLITCAKLHYVVDIDIKAFFDNVNHGKLLKQIWTLGIRDKELIAIISKMLKAEIEGIGKQERGTPQGGILSPLLSGIVLNELDWWIASQWEEINTERTYLWHGDKTRALKKTNLKEMHIVRYADDFKIFCRNAKDAQKAFIATKAWLMERLGLEVSPEKSKVINLRRNYSNFLGFKLKAKTKGNKIVMKSHICDKSKGKIIERIKAKIRDITKNPTTESCNKYNATILGIQNYYKIASNCNMDFSKIGFLVRKSLYNGTRSIRSDTGQKTKTYERLYGNYNFKITYIAKIALFPIAEIKTRPAKPFLPDICQYTEEGRRLIHEKLSVNIINGIEYLLKSPLKTESVEYNDNRISLYSGQRGKCYVTRKPLLLNNMEMHRKIPKSNGGTDGYNNLVLIQSEIEQLINEQKGIILDYLVKKLKIDEKGLKRINELRKLVGNDMIYKE
jgi:group II intron reverse transcriptase/maturase